MSDKNVVKALVAADSSIQERERSPRQMAHQILKRDRMRIRILAGLSTFFWILTVIGVVWLVGFYFLYVVPRLDAYAAGSLQLENDWHEWVRAFNAAAEIILTCIISFLLAAIGTVSLVFASRHATLRQIKSDLAEISEQLRQLQSVGR